MKIDVSKNRSFTVKEKIHRQMKKESNDSLLEVDETSSDPVKATIFKSFQ